MIPDDPPLKTADLALSDVVSQSTKNRRAERKGMSVLLSDPRFQTLDLDATKALLQSYKVPSSVRFSPHSFDAVLTTEPVPPLTADNVLRYADGLRLVEVKVTEKPIKDRRLHGFFFGATANEFALAEALGDRFLFAFVVSNEDNAYGKPFAVLLTMSQLNARVQSRRVQYQINLKRTTLDTDPVEEVLVITGSGIQAVEPKTSFAFVAPPSAYLGAASSKKVIE